MIGDCKISEKAIKQVKRCQHTSIESEIKESKPKNITSTEKNIKKY